MLFFFSSGAHSVELKAYAAVPEWDNQVLEMRREEEAVVFPADAEFPEGHMEWVYDRQRELPVIDWDRTGEKK